MTERGPNIPNARSPGTPVCHPNDAYEPSRKTFTIAQSSRGADADYVELHSASAFSFLQAASLPENLIERAVELEMPAMALLDHNGVYGSARFHSSAKRDKVRAHIGAEISVSSFGARLTPPAWLPHQHASEPGRLPLLCTSRTGYQNLCQLITQFKMRETTKGDGAATIEDLHQYATGMVCLKSMTRLRAQRPPTSDRKRGSRSNRPNSRSALSSYDLLAAFASVCSGGIDHQLTRSIDGLSAVKCRENVTSLPQNSF